MRHVIAVMTLVWLASVPVEVSGQGWDSFTKKDEMTGEVEAYATSARTTATESLDFPYRGVEVWLGFGCDGQDEWAYIGFSQEPNLTDTETHDGYNSFRTRVRWDDNITRMRMSQEWGDRFVHFQSNATAIERMAQAKEVLVELDWHGSGTVYFRFSLNGSARAIANARTACEG